MFVILSVGCDNLVLIVMTAEGTKTTASTERTATMPAVTERMSDMAVTTGTIRRIEDMPKKILVNLSEPGVYPAGAMPRKT